jgi:hypothetical protein
MVTRIALTLGCLSAWGCLPLTFSNPGVIDFDRYTSVLIMPPTGDAPDWTQDYLIDEMRSASGFKTVTGDNGAAVDALLTVALTVVLADNHPNTNESDPHYECTAQFDLHEPGGSGIQHDSEDDTSDFENEAIEDTLDEVADHFLRPYRL